MKFVYLDKKDRIRAWFTPRRSWTLSAAALVLLILPVWHESIEGRFVLEPQNRAVLRAMVPGAVDAVFVREGQKVDAGAPVARLRNFTLQSRLGQLQSDYSVAQSRSNTALVQLASLGGITKDRDRLAQQTQAMQREVSSMELKSPISGVVVTARPEDRVSSYVKEGTELAEIADFSVLRARIYVSEYDMHRYREHSSSRISVDGMFEKRNAKIALVAPAASEIEPGLMDTNKYKGLAPPKFYVIDLLVDNADGGLKPGMVGTGRIYRGYRSLAGVGLQVAGEFFGRKLW